MKELYEKINESIKIDWTPLKRKTKLVRNSLSIWKSSNLDNKKSLLKNIFPEGIPINEKRQVWTPIFSLLYQSFSIWEVCFNQMVDSPTAVRKFITLSFSFKREKLGRAKNKN